MGGTKEEKEIRTTAGGPVKVSIIIPVIRPEKAKRCIDMINANAGIPRTDYEILSKVDVDRIGCPNMVKMLTEKARANLVCFLGDDSLPEKKETHPNNLYFSCRRGTLC